MQYALTYVFDTWQNNQLKLILNLYPIFLLYFNNIFLIFTVLCIYTFGTI